MNISINWLKKFVKFRKPVQKLADDLTRVGLEVEQIQEKENDIILKLDVSPNRYDCLSVLGVAREVAMLENKKVILKKFNFTENKINKKLNVEIKDSKICSRYSYYVIDNVKIGKSPKWMVQLLESYGFRALNNVVDITNFVMIALGQPLHAFDYQKIAQNKNNPKIIVRKGKKGESVVTLDNQIYDVDENTIVIERNGEIIDLSGIMGGLKSEIDKKTKTIILQAALFDPVMIRQTRRRLNHETDASYRYERGIDPLNNIRALKYAAKLIEKYAGAKVGELNDLILDKPKKKIIKTSAVQLSNYIGQELTNQQIVEMLSKLGFKINIEKNILKIKVPSWRLRDINFWQDISEEIIRVYDIHNIKLKPIESKKTDQKLSLWEKKEIIKDSLFEMGLIEVYNYSFIGQEDLEKTKNEKHEDFSKDLFELSFPLSPELKYLRPNLSLSLIKTIAKNPQAANIEIFEIGNVFDKAGWSFNKEEASEICIACAGEKTKDAFYYAKKLLNDFEIKNNDLINVYENKSDILKAYKIRKKNVSIVGIDLDKFIQQANFSNKKINLNSSAEKYRDVSEFPAIERDLAFVVDTKIPLSKIKKIILQTSEQIISADLFDEFESVEKLGLNKKSIAFHITIQSKEKTLDSQQGQEIIEKIIKNIENEIHGKIRS